VAAIATARLRLRDPWLKYWQFQSTEMQIVGQDEPHPFCPNLNTTQFDCSLLWLCECPPLAPDPDIGGLGVIATIEVGLMS
jgi:hypothetical protein